MGRAPERRGGAPPGMSRVGGPAAAIPPGMLFDDGSGSGRLYRYRLAERYLLMYVSLEMSS